MALSLLMCSCGSSKPATLTTTSLVTSTTTSPETSTTAGTEGVSVRVVVCPTTFALATQPSTVPLPTSVTVPLPRSMVGQMMVYVDTRNLTMLLGPTSWTCVAAYGADGSGGIDLYPSAEPPPSAYSQVPSSDEAITLVETGGSPVQAAAQACPYFPAAAAATESDLGHGCSAPPKHEKVTHISSSVVAFEDPPGTKGGGVPSGGPYPAYGVVSYSEAAQPGSYVGTCTLPPSGQRFCAFMLNYLQALYGGSETR